MPRQSWPKSQLQSRANVSLLPWANHRKKPSFVLHVCRDAQILVCPKIDPQSYVCKGSASRNEVLTDFLVAKADLNLVPWSEPVIRPCLRTLAISPNPASYQIPTIGVAAPPSSIPIEKPAADLASQRIIRIHALHSEVQFVYPRKLRKIDPSVPYRTVCIGDR